MSEDKEQTLFDVPADVEKKAKSKRHNAITFKSNDQKQNFFLPPSLDELIGTVSLPRFINELVDRLDLTELLSEYKGGGASAFHPGDLLKIWLLGWCRRIYTSRPLSQALRRDIEFMWISGMQHPSYATLSQFRKNGRKSIGIIFKETVKLALKSGMIDGSEVYIDHTKIEADANRYKVTWGKNLERYMERVDADLDKVLVMIDRLNDDEERQFSSKAEREQAVKGLSFEVLDEHIKKINDLMKDGKKGKEEGQAEKDLLRKGKQRLKKKAEYEEKEQALKGRRSMSNTDRDATAMMMKDGVTIRPGYNVGIAAEGTIVTGYDVSDNSNDNVGFQAVYKSAIANTEEVPERVCADSGYGYEETYAAIEQDKAAAYVKYPGWYRELKGKRKPFEAESFEYDKQMDAYRCPNGSIVVFKEIKSRKNQRTGYEETTRLYVAEESACSVCPFKEQCTKAKARTIQVSRRLKEFREKARERLASEVGQRMRSERAQEVETVFGDQKRNWGFGRLHLRGMDGAFIECGLYFSCWNVRKLYSAFMAKRSVGARLPLLSE